MSSNEPPSPEPSPETNSTPPPSENLYDKLDESDKTRFRALFDAIDKNHDGQIEIDELSFAIKGTDDYQDPDLFGGNTYTHIAEMNIIESADADDDKHLNFEEFVSYMIEHEKKLRVTFEDLDKNADGEIAPEEIKAALFKLGLHVTLEEAILLTQRIDTDSNLTLSWTEWRDFFQLYPSAKLNNMVDFWRSGTLVDLGDYSMPPEFTEIEKLTGIWWRHLVAGILAGSMSRTCAAPFDRLKIMLQVHGKEQKLNIKSGMAKMIKEGGYLSLWRGNGTNVIKVAPETAMRFTMYEVIKAVYMDVYSKDMIPRERFIFGSIAGAIAQTVIYPLEVVKTRLSISSTGQYNGILDCAHKILKREGYKVFYRGYAPNLIGIIPYTGIDFAIYETLKQRYIEQNANANPGVFTCLAYGSCSSTLGQLVSYPLYHVRTVLQASTAKKGMIETARRIIEKDGFLGMFRGMGPNFIKSVPSVTVSYIVYEQTLLSLGVVD